MIVERVIEELKKYNPKAVVKMHHKDGEPVLFVLGLTDDDENVFLECESDNDMKEEIAARFEHASEEQVDELDFYLDLLEIGIDVEMVRKYMGDEHADHMKAFCEDHGLI